MTDKQKNVLILVVMFILVVVSIVIIYPPGEKTKLGLDLQGGLEVILEAQGDVSGEKMDQAEMVVRYRVDKLGVSDRLGLAFYAIDHRLCEVSRVPQLETSLSRSES